MSAQKKTERPAGEAAGLKRPFMLAYSVKPIDDGKNAIWSKIGAAWAHKDGQGYEVRMDALPVDGRVVLRTVRDREDGQSGEVLDRTPQ
ncbi:hypothetical protein [Cognatiyoonia sp. IB215182]|uniref:hypothetical protein n=1 Tax=Cognatiyoonia sp. IB215182 TaxID=3097353 RepID=UPI002A0DAE78|nr:hypothetical protein [Cognatiyoonia sp. IB215182]MDX8353990.1 hypothetical protein [Cognatiyoonia sp. IB215182]